MSSRERRYIFDITPQDHARMVLENSKKGAVLVYHWSPHAAPCMMLLPRLVHLADEYAGRFLLTLLNVDEYAAFSKSRGVLSIPTVQVYFREALAETVNGAYSEKFFRDLIDKYIPRRAPFAPELGGAHLTHRKTLDAAKRKVQRGEIQAAADLLAALPREAMRDAEIDLLAAHLQILTSAEAAPPLDELQAREELTAAQQFQLAARLLLADQTEVALQQWQKLLQSDDDIAAQSRRAAIAVLALLGPAHALSRKFRDVFVAEEESAAD